MKTIIFQIFTLIGMLVLPARGDPKSSVSERQPREDTIELIENVISGGKISIEGRVDIIDNVYYLYSLNQPSKKYRLVLDVPNKTIDRGNYIVTCRIKFVESMKHIESLTVIELDPIPIASQEAIEGLVAEVNDLNDIALSDKGSEKLQDNIERLKITLMAQYHFFACYYPHELAKAKKMKNSTKPRDPFGE